MALFVGIIGLPNVGKSTLFNALTGAGAEASNYPFCTVDPNVGMVEVPDARLVRLHELLKPESCTPTHIRFVDIAGLVRGASAGEGLGNRFLSHVREADVILNVVRCFDDDQVSHVDGPVDPARDVDTIQTELVLADLESAKNGKQRLDRILTSTPQAPERTELDTIQRIMECLEDGTPVHRLGLAEPERQSISSYNFLTGKPVLYLANVGETDLPDGGAWASKLRKQVETDRVLVLAAQIESEIVQLPTEERESFLKDLGLSESGLNRLILVGYSLLELITFYTLANEKLQAWQLTQGSHAPAAAGRIHSDMEKGFIRAEVVAYVDLIAEGGVDGARHAGKLRTEGKDYEVMDGDVIQFLFQS